MNAMIPMYVYTTNFIAGRVEAVKDHSKNNDRGSSMVEYAGLIVLALIILTAIYAAFRASNFQALLGSKIGHLFDSKSIGGKQG